MRTRATVLHAALGSSDARIRAPGLRIDLRVMRTHRPSGHTLLELVSVLLLLAVSASAFAPTARRMADRAAVVSAREEVVRALTRARSAAVSGGGSTVTLIARPATVRISVRGRSVRETPVGDEGTTLTLTAGRDSTVLRFDPLGIGRFANGTAVIRRGDAEAGLVISSYGRVRRR